LGEKKLIILNLPSENNDDTTEFLTKTIEKIPENNIVLFYTIHPDKRTKLYKKLVEKCLSKDFSISDNTDIKNIITKKYPDQISYSAIDTIIQYKSGNLAKIISEIDKLLITKDFIEPKDITENIAPELEESIFQIIDDILNKNILEAIKKIKTTLGDINVYAFYNNLLANLRTSTYIHTYKQL
jgi:DNA polymerase III delta subunit